MTRDITTRPFRRVHQPPEHVPARVLMLPGVHYSCARPLLNWCAAIAHQCGWWVQQAWWAPGAEANTDAFVAAALERLDEDAPGADETLVIAKSMGSRAAAAASQRHWSGIWLTPLLADPGVRAALLGYRAGCLLVGGDADRLWTPPADRVDLVVTRGGELRSTHPGDVSTSEEDSRPAAGQLARNRWVQVSGANHSLEIPGDWHASLTVQQTVLELVDDFLTTLDSSAGAEKS